MADHDLKIKVKAEGADGAAAKISDIGKVFQRLLKPIAAVRTAAASLFRTLGTVSFIIHGVSLVVDSVKRLHDWLGRARKAAVELSRAQELRGFADALDRAAERGKALAERTADALANIKEIARQGAAERAADKGLASAQLAYDEQTALAGVTDKDRKQSIKDEFALKRADAERDAAVKEIGAKRRDINSQLAAAYDAIGREDRFREGRSADREALYQDWWNPQDKKLRKDIRKKTAEIMSSDGSLNESQARRKALDEIDEARKRKERLDAMDKEIAASDKRTKELNKLVESLKHERSLLDTASQTAELKQKATYAEVANAQADREAERQEKERKQVEEFVKISERNMAKADRQRAQDEIETKEDEVKKAEDALRNDPERALVKDRISAMGGFATAGAAAFSGVAAGRDKSYEELRQHRDLLKQEIDQLKKIVKNTEDGGAVFG